MAAYVGLDPVNGYRLGHDRRTPSRWNSSPTGRSTPSSAFPPEPQELRAAKIGHVILNTAIDRPWSQYFCCMLAGNADYVHSYPVATKRVLRAILKAADLCAVEPQRVAQRMVDRRFRRRATTTRCRR